MDPRLARLIDRQQIKDVVYRYCRGIDRRDLELVRACYHPDATDHHGSFEGTVDAYLEWVDGLLERYSGTMHLVGNILIDRGDREDCAAVETYGVAIHRSPEEKAHLNLATGFRYVDRFERRADDWKIASRVAVSEWSIQLPQEAWWPLPDSLIQGQRNGSDVLYALLSSIGAQQEHAS